MTEQTALTGNAVETILKAAAQPSASIIDVSTITRGALPLLMTPSAGFFEIATLNLLVALDLRLLRTAIPSPTKSLP